MLLPQARYKFVFVFAGTLPGSSFFHLERHWTKIHLRLPFHLSLFYSIDVLAAFPRLELAATNTAIKRFLVSSLFLSFILFLRLPDG